MLIILHGVDTFRSRQRLKEFEKAYLEKNKENFDYEKRDAAELGLNEFKNLLEAQSLFTQKRFIVIENISENKNILEKLHATDSMPQVAGNVVVFYESASVSKNTGYKNILQQADRVEEFKQLSAPEATRWFLQYFTKAQKKFDQNIIREVVAACRADMWQTYNELEKLYTYKAGGSIAKQDLETMNIGSEEARIFPTIDAIFAKRSDAAFKNLLAHWREGEHPHYIFTMIERQLRITASVKDEKEKGASPDAIAKKLAQHPFVVKKTIPVADRFSWDKLKGLYARVESLDIKSKTGQIEPRLACELLAAAIVSS